MIIYIVIACYVGMFIGCAILFFLFFLITKKIIDLTKKEKDIELIKVGVKDILTLSIKNVTVIFLFFGLLFIAGSIVSLFLIYYNESKIGVKYAPYHITGKIELDFPDTVSGERREQLKKDFQLDSVRISKHYPPVRISEDGYIPDSLTVEKSPSNNDSFPMLHITGSQGTINVQYLRIDINECVLNYEKFKESVIKIPPDIENGIYPVEVDKEQKKIKFINPIRILIKD